MTSAAAVERHIAQMLAHEAGVRAPEGSLAAVLARVDRVPQRRRPLVPLGTSRVRMDGRRRLLLVLAAALTVLGAALAGAILSRRDVQPRDPSSLVILEHQPFVAGETRPVTVLAVDPDGRRSVLMTIDPGQLEGTYSQWYAGVSIDGHLVVPTSTVGGASVPAVLDLRDPTAPALLPDAEGAMPKFGPDGRLAMTQNDGQTAIFDPLRGTTVSMRPSAASVVVERDFGPVWSTDGGFLATRGLVIDGDVELLHIDSSGNARRDAPHAYYAGVGARRVDGVGRLLRCDVGTDDPCEGPISLYSVGPEGSPVVWRQTDFSVRVIDFAWGVEDTLWILTETAAEGPRTVDLHRIDAALRDTVVATLAAQADDPDPLSYSAAARFAAFSADDRRIIVEVSGDQGARLWSIDPEASLATRLPDGIVAGWLTPTSLTSPRPSVEPTLELPTTLRGSWVRGDLDIDVGRRQIVIRVDGLALTAIARADRTGELVVEDLSGIHGCATGRATYGWTVGPEGLRLTPRDEPCEDRGGLLSGAFERSLGSPDTGSVATDPGERYLASAFDHPFRAQMPTGQVALVSSHRADWVTIHTANGDEATTLMFLIPDRGFTDPCSSSSSAISLAERGDVQAYLDGLTTVRMQPLGTIRVGDVDVPLVRPDAVDIATCPEIGLLQVAGYRRPYRVDRQTRLAVIPRDGGDVLIVITHPSAAGETWVRDLLRSIEWLP